MHDEFGFHVPCPDDRAMRKFLWYDFFHDATLERIEYGKPDRRDVTLTVRIPEAMVRPAFRKICGAYFLRFHRIHHFDYATGASLYLAEGIYSTDFMDTPLLHRLQKNCAKPLYHLRIHTNCGLMDIIFERFTIRRAHGRISYRWEPRNGWFSWDESMERLIRTIPEETLSADIDLLDDIDRSAVLLIRLYRAWQAQDIPGILAHARRLLTEAMHDGWGEYAAMMLGHYGDQSDVPALMRLHTFPEAPAASRQTALDAIERIHEREKEA